MKEIDEFIDVVSYLLKYIWKRTYFFIPINFKTFIIVIFSLILIIVTAIIYKVYIHKNLTKFLNKNIL